MRLTRAQRWSWRGVLWLMMSWILLLGSARIVDAQPASTPVEPVLRLEDLERMALEQNPTLPQARATVRAAEGRYTQAGIYPNPLIGYALEDFNARKPGRNKHFFWFQVPIVTAGKLQRSQNLAAADRQHAEVSAEAQRLRVLTTVRMLYYEALGAARVVVLRAELARLVREAVDVSEQLFNVGQADRPDVLEVEIQSQRTELDLARAQTDQERVWRALAAMVGSPALPLTALAGDLEVNVPQLDREAIIAKVLRESPEVRLAQINVERARAALERVRAERIPNFFVRTRLGYNSEPFAAGGDVGFEGGLEIGIPLPLFDRQQGNITNAEADLEHTRGEVRRLELALRSQLTAAIKRYEDARGEVERYQRQILPRAREAFELYRKRFQQMAAAYPQVIIAERALYDARAEYVRALIDVWQGATLFDGLLLRGGLEAPAHATVQPPPPSGHLPSPAGRPAN